MGIREFFQRPVSWRGTLLTTASGFAGLAFFTFVYDSAPERLTVFTIAPMLPLVLNLKLLLSGWPASLPLSSSPFSPPDCLAR